MSAVTRAPRAAGSGRPPQRGVSLIEFLVVLVIITIGLLSVAGMLAFGIKQDFETTFRTLTAAQSKDLAERMHANLLGASLGFYRDTSAATGCTAEANTAGACPTGVSSSRCAAAKAIANADRTAWNATTRDLLPAATCAVTFDANGVYTISIGWTENVRQLGGGTTTTATPRIVTYRYQSIPDVYAR